MTTNLPAIATGHGRVAELLDPATVEDTPELVAWLRERYGTLRGLLVRTARDLVDIGRILGEVQDTLNHQEFLAFVAYAGISRATAYRWIAAAQAAEGCSHVENVEPTALYALASRSTPDDVRERFLRRADTGYLVTHQEVKAALRRSEPDPEPVAPNLTERLLEAVLDAEEATLDAQEPARTVRTAWIGGEISSYSDEDRPIVADIVRAWGHAFAEAAEPHLAKEVRR